MTRHIRTILLGAAALYAATPALAAGEQALVKAAAAALGGEDKLRAINTITLNGYGQYAYMFGGGRITGEPDAPEKYIAANDLSRVYDIANNRFELVERRVMLFPFLGSGGHNFSKTVQRLDGDVAYDVRGDKATRVAAMSDNPLQVDGVHVRRMLMLTNPIVLVRRMMDPATKLAARKDKRETVVDITLAEGDKLKAGFAANGLPIWVRWSTKQTNVGQMDFTTRYSGWSDATGLSGVKLPLGYVTRESYRDVDFFKLYVDGYRINPKVPDIAASAAVRAQAEPASYAVPTITSKAIGKGIWRVDQGGTMAIEFKDHVLLYEANVNTAVTKAVMAHVRTLVPGKPITQIVFSHPHFDHTAGLRQSVAEGLTVIQREGSRTQFAEMAAHPAPDFPDDQARAKAPFKFLAVDDHLRLSDETQTVDLYWALNDGHMADILIAYVPSEKLLIEGDMVTAAVEWQHWPDAFRDVIAKNNLVVDRVAPVHPDALAPGEATLTRARAEQLLKEGTDRARAHCAAEEATNHYHPGCPIQTKYY